MSLEKKSAVVSEEWLKNPYLILHLGECNYLVDLFLRYQYDELIGESWYDLLEIGEVWKLAEKNIYLQFKYNKYLKKIITNGIKTVVEDQQLLDALMLGGVSCFYQLKPRITYSLSFSKSKRRYYANR